MELNDKEFDAAFRKKVFDADPQFEEAAWDKMEQKLKRRDRLVFFRNSAVICLTILIAFIGFYSIDDKEIKSGRNVAVHVPSNTMQIDSMLMKHKLNEQVDNGTHKPAFKQFERPAKRIFYASDAINKNEVTSITTVDTAAAAQDLLVTLPSATLTEKKQVPVSENRSEIPTDTKMQSRAKRLLPVSLSITAGPEFNSASSLIGGSAGFSAGLGFGIGLTKKLSMQAGIQYSIKGYRSDNLAYKFNNERVQSLISSVDATCDVLELPILVSYRISENYKRSIDLNAGISSYFMLKEDYLFKYTPQSGIADRLVEWRNENQHYMSVVNLSATYFIKVKKEQLQLGVEPFVKIPLSGVGEGKINLKSNGISLRLRYDIDKKNN